MGNGNPFLVCSIFCGMCYIFVTFQKCHRGTLENTNHYSAEFIPPAMEIAMRLKVTEIDSGLHPSQVVLSIKGEDETHYIVVNRHSVESGSIDVGHYVGRRDDSLLVELPTETENGAWRVWVKKNETLPDKKLEAAE